MKDGRITQVGKYNDILKSGSDFMELVGAHKEALSALDSIEAGAAAVGEDSSTGNAKNSLQKKKSPTDQNDKTNNAMGTNGQLIQEEEREKGRVGLSLSMLLWQSKVHFAFLPEPCFLLRLVIRQLQYFSTSLAS
ncbi:ABC transporter C family member 7 [Forsythia ovata]|uniref:ABC transporter C family member 7 n=1 Tax=Forsythia ovata TaxID=205694 RepID=A0ABD1S4X1_9LAMI